MKQKIVLLCAIIIYTVLAWKSIYSERTLVANLEPYPDTFYYSVPAWNFVHGKGFTLTDGVKSGKWITPPVYTLWLVPFFKVFGDVRSYYVANYILAIGSIVCLYFLAKKIYRNNWIATGMVLLLWITNFYFFTLPSLLMAENMSVFLCLLGILVIANIDNKGLKIFTLSLISVLLFLTKFSNLPVAGLCLFASFVELITQRKIRNMGLFVAPIFVGLLFIYKSNILSLQVNTNPEVGFGLHYFFQNFSFYIKTIFGSTTRYLWFSKNLLWSLVGVMGIIGLVIKFCDSKYRKVSSFGLLTIVCVIIFMSFFYFPDARYIQILSPILVLFSFEVLGYFKKIYYLPIALFLGIYIFLNIKSWRLQMAINFKYAENPWNYIAIKSINTYFVDTKERYVFSFLPRFMFYYYSNKHYIYEPLVGDGRFDLNIESLKEIDYLLSQNKEVYFTNAYEMNNNDNLDVIENLQQKFNIVLSTEGCQKTCNIYKIVSIKK